MNIFSLVATITQLLSWMIVARLILDMVTRGSSLNPSSNWVQTTREILYRITEPILSPIRRMVYRGGPFDFSPMIAILLLWMISIVFSRAG
ncbi:MAG: YggT family protein [Dehalococcoidia bacterium]